tara:strand:+ start:131 stop:493 length:363 start_codon:yes stop_codon:yes gene_type:complete
MKATELRIGNWVEIQGLQSKVILVDVEECICENEYCEDFENNKITQNLQPIPLTKEWLEKFGFENNSMNLDEEGFLHLDISFLGGVNVYINDMEYPHINYVHQLQNLYFALTGEELIQRR